MTVNIFVQLLIRGGLGRGKTFDTAIMTFQTPSKRRNKEEENFPY
jgi:hypothetical protein